MTKVRAAYGAVVLITAALFFWSARLYLLGLLVTEILFPVVLRILLRVDQRHMQISLDTRTASVAGQNLSVSIRVRAPFWIAAGMLSAVLEVDNRMLGRTERIPVSMGLSKGTVSVYLPCRPRGCGYTQIRLKEALFCDIMGLNVLKAPEPKPVGVTVYPERLQLDVTADSSLSGFQEGEQQTVSKRGHDPSEVFDLREYRPGDDVRSIHWKLSGKLEEFLVKEPSDTSHYSTMVLLDAGLQAGTETCGDALLSHAVGLALIFSERLMELGILHYTCIPAGEGLFFRQVTERAEYTKLTDIWMGLSLEEQAGEGLKLFLTDPLFGDCHHMVYITAGGFPPELDLVPDGLHMTAICIQEGSGEVQITRKGLGVLMEIPEKRLRESVYNIAI